jgi:hypothetical protein
MACLRSDITSIEPRLLRREDGGWLAVSPPDAPLHVGVAAWSADDARDRFARELDAWADLLDEQPSNHTLGGNQVG